MSMDYSPPRGEPEVEELQRVHAALKQNGVNFATGVPCGGQEGTIYHLINDSEIQHVAANREGEAVGIAAGARMAGQTPLVYMQNSGFFDSTNELGSLLQAYEIPIFYSVTWRGCPGENTPQHIQTGDATRPLLEDFDVPYRVLGEDPVKESIEWLFTQMRSESQPVVLLVPRRWYQ